MAKPEGPSGQQKLHTVKLPDGSTIQVTQEDWKKRDKKAGWVRVDETGNPIPEEPEPTGPPPA